MTTPEIPQAVYEAAARAYAEALAQRHPLGDYLHHNPAVRACVESAYNAGVAAGRAPLLGLLRQLTDPDPCRYDHHGYCQAHSLDPDPCPHAISRLVLAANPEGQPAAGGGETR